MISPRPSTIRKYCTEEGCYGKITRDKGMEGVEECPEGGCSGDCVSVLMASEIDGVDEMVISRKENNDPNNTP